MKIKTSDLTSSALDWAVSLITNPDWGHDDRIINVQGYDEDTYQPSIEWAQGGPIIDREQVSVECIHAASDGVRWQAWTPAPEHGEAYGVGPTPLIAAMRCYVASKLGDSVEVPDELR